MREFAKTLGRVIKRPSWFPVPAFLLRLLFGEMADETLLAGQKVLPEALLRAGYKFYYPEIEAALKDILRAD
jgi:NAD dependent epimerase/dehydratase family enzyme